MDRDVPKRRVLLLEDDPLTLTLLELAIQAAGFDTWGFSSVTAAKHGLNKFDPDMAILDIDLGPGLTGVDFAKVMIRSHPHVGILFISQDPQIEFTWVPKDHQDNIGFLSKLDLYDFDTVRVAIEECLRPGSKGVNHQIFVAGQGLTARQHSLLLGIAEGMTNQELAAKEGTTVRAIEYMAERIQRKLPEILLDSKTLRLESVRTYLKDSS